MSAEPSMGGLGDYMGAPDPYAGGGGGTSQWALSLPRLMRHKWLMLSIFVVVAGSTIPLIWKFVKPVYSATAVVRVKPTVEKVLYQTEDQRIIPLYRGYLNTQVSIIRSRKVIERVLDDPEVQKTYWYREEGKSLLREPVSPFERLLKTLSVRPRRDTELIDVTMTTQQPRDAQLIVDKIVDLYWNLSDEANRTQDQDRITKLKEIQQQLTRDRNNLSTRKEMLANNLGTIDPTQLTSSLVTRRSELEARVDELKQELALLEFQKQSLGGPSAGASQPAEGAASQPADTLAAAPQRAFIDDPDWRRFNIDLKKAENDLQVAREKYGELNPRFREMQANVDNLKMLLKEREAQLEDQWKRMPLVMAGQMDGTGPLNAVALQHQIDVKTRELNLAMENLDRAQERVTSAAFIAKEISQIDRELARLDEQYQEVRQRIETLTTEAQAPGRVSVASYSLAPSTPDRDPRFIFTVMSLGGALTLALAVGYLRTGLNAQLHEVGDVQHSVRAPFLGQLPRMRPDYLPREIGGSNTSLVRRDAADDAAAFHHQTLMESMRMIRTSLLERVSLSGEQVVLITSPKPAAGKTSVAVLLAKSLSVVGKRVLLIEADVRKPTMAARLGIESRYGLAALLCGLVDSEEKVIRRTTFTQFDVVPVGEVPDQFDTELLANGVFTSRIAKWRKSYDFIILDSPPVLPVADARILARHADGTVMVLRSSHDKRNEAVEAYAQLSAAGGKLLGTVFIGGGMGDGYGYGYRNGYGYGYGYGYGRSNGHANGTAAKGAQDEATTAGRH